MKLYYTPGACSQAPHIALRELGLTFDTIKVDLAKHTLPDGSDFRAINPKGYVPLLELDDGTRLSEASVILQYVADQKPGTLAPVFGTLARWKLMEWMAFISTEVHKGFGPLWNPKMPAEVRGWTVQALGNRFTLIAKTLAGQPYLTGPDVLDRGCLPVRGFELDRTAQGRPHAVAGADRIPGSGRGAAGGAGHVQGRRVDQVDLTPALSRSRGRGRRDTRCHDYPRSFFRTARRCTRSTRAALARPGGRSPIRCRSHAPYWSRRRIGKPRCRCWAAPSGPRPSTTSAAFRPDSIDCSTPPRSPRRWRSRSQRCSRPPAMCLR